MNFRIVFLSLCVVCFFYGCQQQPISNDREWVFGDSGSGQPHFSRLDNDQIILNWMQPNEESMELMFSIINPDLAWTEPLPIARGDDWFVNWADFPAVVQVADEALVSHWLVYQEDFSGYDIMLSISNDLGETWSNPQLLNSDGLPAEHGFVETFPELNGFGMVWLDGRDYVADQFDDEIAGTMLRYASFSPTGERIDEVILDQLVCDCCQPDVAQANGMTYIVYRDRTIDEIRDITMLVHSKDEGWKESVSLPADRWEINGCPVNGPALAANAEGIGVIWFSARDQEPQVQFAFKAHNTDLFLSRTVLEDFVPWGYVDIVFDELHDQFILSWLRDSENGLQLVTRSVDKFGTLKNEVIIFESQISYPLDFPKIEIVGNYLLASWTDFTDGMKLKVKGVELTKFN